MVTERLVTIFDCAKCPECGCCDAHGDAHSDKIHRHREGDNPCRVTLPD